MSNAVLQPAFITLKHFNKNMQIGKENGLYVGLEDVIDSDGRIYRIEYQSTLDGKHANAFCRSNPWDRRAPHAGTRDIISHVYPDGFICMAPGVNRQTASSPFNLEMVIKRGRFWCTAFSAYKENGNESVFNL